MDTPNTPSRNTLAAFAPARDGLEYPCLSRRAILAGAAGLAGVVLFSSHGAGAVGARNVRLGNHGTFTRVVIDVTGDVPFSAFSLTNPARIIIDLPEIDWQFEQPTVPGKPGLLVKAMRYGLFQPGNSRIVLDLAEPAAVKNMFVLPPGEQTSWRLVVDLAPVDEAMFLRSAGPRNRTGTFRPKHGPQDTEPATTQADNTPTRQPMTPEKRKAAPSPAKPVIVLDPGHGGIDPGATGVSGIFEKNLTLSTARELKAALDKTGRYTVHLTRDRDIFLQLRERVAIARTHRADLFISIHADAGAKPSIRGLSVYTLSDNASDAEAAALATSENKADIIAGIDLSHESKEVTNILIDLAQRETMNLSSRLAEIVIAELQRDVTLLPRSHRFAGFAVLKAPDIPSFLMEMGYLTNRDEERLLRTRGYRKKLASAMVRAIDRYFSATQKASLP
ncbi:AMIN domain-containing protein [Haematospirillum sp. H1815]|uniref:N-acetylmuramoyl-L-alanine amidase n=1 Tax=Haematospirillum sp. H1815 TaxID=2723108 RepID=UPI00143AAD41|nr:N-acetylmuramoyl-L-alanine amidase [Haematospirillum sp. H1815]NKD76694.1 AMIN domain-containing protein [Haematospirillum sp. H1815]